MNNKTVSSGSWTLAVHFTRTSAKCAKRQFWHSFFAAFCFFGIAAATSFGTAFLVFVTAYGVGFVKGIGESLFREFKVVRRVDRNKNECEMDVQHGAGR